MLQLFCTTCNQLVETEQRSDLQDGCIGVCPHCGTHLAAMRYIAPGTTINGYTVEREIGRGGMGVVYLAKQLNLDRDVALKVLSDEMASDKTFIKAFFREARAAAALNHPNIVQAYDAGMAENGIYYFVMELIEGENLEVYIREHGALDLDLGFQCAVKICNALAYAWNSKMLAHRDIKPENIIFKDNREFKLADLGLAKDYKENSAESDEEMMATPAYASPEVIRGEKEKIGFKSDMYSFGATLYQIFTGRAPFEGDDPMAVCEKQLNEQPKPLIGVNPELPSRLSMLVDKLMEKDPEKRPESWDFVLSALNEIVMRQERKKYDQTHHVETMRVVEPQPQAPAEFKRDSQAMANRKKPVLLILIIAVLFLLVAVCGVILLMPDKKAQQTAAPVVPQTAETTVPPPAPSTDAVTEAEIAEAAAQQEQIVQTDAQPQEKPAEEEAAPAPAPVSKQPEVVVVSENDPWKRIEQHLAKTPYQRWCQIVDFLESQENAAQYPEAEAMKEKLEFDHMATYLEKLEADKNRFEVQLHSTNLRKITEPDEIRSILSEYRTFMRQTRQYERWAEKVVKKEDIAAFKKKEQWAQGYENVLRRKIAQAQRQEKTLLNSKASTFSELAGKLTKLDKTAFLTAVSEWEKRYDPVLNSDDSEDIQSLKSLAEANALSVRTIAEILKNTVIYPNAFPNCTFKESTDKHICWWQKIDQLKMKRITPWEDFESRKTEIISDLLQPVNRKALKDASPEVQKAIFVQSVLGGGVSMQYMLDTYREMLGNNHPVLNQLRSNVKALPRNLYKP